MRTTTYVMGNFRPRLRTIVDGHEDKVVLTETDPIVWQLWSMAQVQGIIEVSVSGNTTYVTIEHGKEAQVLDFFRKEYRASDAKPLRKGAPRLLSGKVYVRGETQAELEGFVESVEVGVKDVLTKLVAGMMPAYSYPATRAKAIPAAEARAKQEKLDEAHLAVTALQRFITGFKEMMEIK